MKKKYLEWNNVRHEGEHALVNSAPHGVYRNNGIGCGVLGVVIGRYPILQWWSDHLSIACHVKWVAPMDKRCMTMRPELDWEMPNSRR
ncbi:hypothetical protein YC2023_033393 [Brassica napus]